MRLSRRVFLLLALLWLAGSRAASAQVPLAELQCQGNYAGVAYGGLVTADLWQYAGAVPLGSAGERMQLNLYLRQGEMDKIPGTVRLFGWLQDSYRNLVNFEVFLTQVTSGTGSVWVNHQRHRETYMTLVIKAGGFDIYPETGGSASFACE